MEVFDGAGNVLGEMDIDTGDDWLGCFMIVMGIVLFIIYGAFRLLYLGFKALLSVPKENFSFLALTLTVGTTLLIGVLLISIQGTANQARAEQKNPGVLNGIDTSTDSPLEGSALTNAEAQVPTPGVVPPADQSRAYYNGGTLGGNVTLHTGPGDDYPTISTLTGGTIVTNIGQDENGWTLVEGPMSVRGWAKTGLLPW